MDGVDGWRALIRELSRLESVGWMALTVGDVCLEGVGGFGDV